MRFNEINSRKFSKQGVAEGHADQQAAITIAMKKAHKKPKTQHRLNEFAPVDGGDDGFGDETLKRLAALWWRNDEDPVVERILAAAGWEIGQDEGYDNGGVFVVQSGDINGNSYISWPAEELDTPIDESWEPRPNLKQRAWQQSQASSSTADVKVFSFQGHTLKFHPDRLDIYKGADLVYSRPGDYANPTKVKVAAAHGIVGRLIANEKEAQRRATIRDKKKPDLEEMLDKQLAELKCWPGYRRVRGSRPGAPGSCEKK